MADFDLIPADYRRALRRLRWLKQFSAAFVATAVVCLGGNAALQYETDGVEAEVATLRETRSVNERQGRELARLQQERESYAAQLQLLEGLRGGTPATRMFSVVDEALVDDSVWFLNWRFQRAGSSVPEAPQATNTGYFIVLPRDAQSTAQKIWQIETHMTIKGRSRDHAALSKFVNALFGRPEIQDVKVLRTALRESAAGPTVDFDLAVLVNNRAAQ